MVWATFTAWVMPSWRQPTSRRALIVFFVSLQISCAHTCASEHLRYAGCGRLLLHVRRFQPHRVPLLLETVQSPEHKWRRRLIVRSAHRRLYRHGKLEGSCRSRFGCSEVAFTLLQSRFDSIGMHAASLSCQTYHTVNPNLKCSGRSCFALRLLCLLTTLQVRPLFLPAIARQCGGLARGRAREEQDVSA